MEQPNNPTFKGLLEIESRGSGHLRMLSLTMKSNPDDPSVSPQTVDRFGLKSGVQIEASVRKNKRGQPEVDTITTIQGLAPAEWRRMRDFSDHTVIQPHEPITLTDIEESTPGMRIVELFCPIGKGQRGLIVSPPKAGKTRLMQEIAHSVSSHHPEMRLIVLLIDERPEEVTDMRRAIKGEVFASSSDAEGENHLRLTQFVLDYAKRRVETGEDVIILVDSLTRIGRAFNVHQRGSGRTLSGGMDSRALEIPRRLFGAARNLEGGGSLTIMATILVETNSRMDEYIFQEFKGTGNMELVLSRELAEERIFPAINLNASGTRNEELLFGDATSKHHKLRRSIQAKQPKDAMEDVLSLLKKFPTNEELVSKFTG